MCVHLTKREHNNETVEYLYLELIPAALVEPLVLHLFKVAFTYHFFASLNKMTTGKCILG